MMRLGAIHPTSIISQSATLHPDVAVGAGAIIGDNVSVGAGSVIGPQVIWAVPSASTKRPLRESAARDWAGGDHPLWLHHLRRIAYRSAFRDWSPGNDSRELRNW